jgi:hypothetical protein
MAGLHWRMPSIYVLDRLLMGPLIVLAGLALGGVVLLARNGEWLLSVYVSASLLLIGLTPWPQQFVRYCSPLTPFFLIATAHVLSGLATFGRDGADRRIWRLASASLAAMLLVLEGLAVYKLFSTFHQAVALTSPDGRSVSWRLFYYDEHWRAHDAALDWLRTGGQPPGVIATATPHWAYLRTGRKAVLPPLETDAERGQTLLDSVPVRFLVIDSMDWPDSSRRYAEPVIRAHPERWELVYLGRSRVFRRRPPGAPARLTP